MIEVYLCSATAQFCYAGSIIIITVLAEGSLTTKNAALNSSFHC